MDRVEAVDFTISKHRGFCVLRFLSRLCGGEQLDDETRRYTHFLSRLCGGERYETELTDNVLCYLNTDWVVIGCNES